MMPLSGECSAAWQRSCGSRACAARPSSSSSVTPLRGALADGLKTLRLAGIARHHELAAAPMADAACAAQGVQLLAPGDAQSRFERARAVVDAGVDDFAVAAAGAAADLGAALEDQGLVPARGERAPHCQADDARTDHHGLHFVHRVIVRERGAPPAQAGAPDRTIPALRPDDSRRTWCPL